MSKKSLITTIDELSKELSITDTDSFVKKNNEVFDDLLEDIEKYKPKLMGSFGKRIKNAETTKGNSPGLTKPLVPETDKERKEVEIAKRVGREVFAMRPSLKAADGGKIQYYLNSLKASLESRTATEQNYVMDHMSNSGHLVEKEVIIRPEIPSMLSCKISRFFEELKIKAKKILGIKPKHKTAMSHNIKDSQSKNTATRTAIGPPTSTPNPPIPRDRGVQGH